MIKKDIVVLSSGSKIVYVLTQSEHIVIEVSPHVSATVCLYDTPSLNAHCPITVIAGESATVVVELLVMHAQNISISFDAELYGVRANVVFKVWYALAEHQIFSLKTQQSHQARWSQSDIVVKGMLNDQATMKYHGLIHIQEQASGTNAQQSHTNIGLSNQVTVVSVPSIEVLQNNVACYHASAMGTFDQKHLLYLRSRGFDQDRAYQMLTYAFFEGLLEDRIEEICAKIVR